MDADTGVIFPACDLTDEVRYVEGTKGPIAIRLDVEAEPTTQDYARFVDEDGHELDFTTGTRILVKAEATQLKPQHTRFVRASRLLGKKPRDVAFVDMATGEKSFRFIAPKEMLPRIRSRFYILESTESGTHPLVFPNPDSRLAFVVSLRRGELMDILDQSEDGPDHPEDLDEQDS